MSLRNRSKPSSPPDEAAFQKEQDKEIEHNQKLEDGPVQEKEADTQPSEDASSVEQQPDFLETSVIGEDDIDTEFWESPYGDITIRTLMVQDLPQLRDVFTQSTLPESRAIFLDFLLSKRVLFGLICALVALVFAGDYLVYSIVGLLILILIVYISIRRKVSAHIHSSLQNEFTARAVESHYFLNGGYVWVALNAAGKLAAFAGLEMLKLKEKDTEESPHIRRLCVLPSLTTDVTAMLLHRMEEFGRRAGWTELCVVLSPFQHKMIDRYQRQGFSQREVIRKEYSLFVVLKKAIKRKVQ
eukprot:TRINITY_DN2934_c0_g2_i1.p1 TRINITY_DN2934_c0_g2~~TRINITY_DN2934_c0_g2_i1.p1  ORF type:complete len:320 (-),score=66.27 TRINITY_DN2934_c0_g2_i1:24-920(-)